MCNIFATLIFCISLGSVATCLRYDGLLQIYCRVYRERILKIGQHLPKLCLGIYRAACFWLTV